MTGPVGPTLVTGASGLLGTWLRGTAPAEIELVSVVHRRALQGRSVEADLRDGQAVEAAVAAVEPDLVIHAAFARDEASIVGATRHMIDGVQRSGADLIFISTESVFSGDGEARSESATPDPVYDYGRWKAEAEDLVTATVPNAAIVRLPLIVSLDPPDHMLADIGTVGSNGERSIWFSDEIRQPAWGEDLARGVWDIAALPEDRRSGVWHLPGPERLSRYDMATRGVEAAGLDPSWIASAPSPPHTKRPRDLFLTADRARNEIGWSPRPVYRPS